MTALHPMCGAWTQDHYAQCIREAAHGGDHVFEVTERKPLMPSASNSPVAPKMEPAPDQDPNQQARLSNALMASFEGWWRKTSEEDWESFGPKLGEYGAGDLEAIGRDLCGMMGWDDAPARVHAEIGVAFYLRGKIARMFSAYEQHRIPSDDTWKDADVYCTMARRIRFKGELS